MKCAKPEYLKKKAKKFGNPINNKGYKQAAKNMRLSSTLNAEELLPRSIKFLAERIPEKEHLKRIYDAGLIREYLWRREGLPSGTKISCAIILNYPNAPPRREIPSLNARMNEHGTIVNKDYSPDEYNEAPHVLTLKITLKNGAIIGFFTRAKQNL